MGIFSFLFKRSGLGWMSGRNYVSAQTSEKIREDWLQVEEMLRGKSPSQLKQALLVADKSVDNALKDLVSGETMGERLKNAKDKFDRDMYDKLWKAHKVRNNLVHESGYNPPHYVISSAVADFKKALNHLGVRL